MTKAVRTLALCAVLLAIPPVASAAPQEATPAAASDAGAIAVPSGVSYELLGRWDTDRLNQILTTDFPKFAGIDVTYTPARNAVKLYRVTYPSVVPERGNKPIVATGLLAIPDTDAKSFPILSYQHGTVYGRQEVPSFPEQSTETQLMLAQFAGQGYVVMGADYFGMGASKEPEGYMVKASHQQACHDMIRSGRGVLDSMGITSDKLFLGGWSQGGFVTMACLEKLESAGVAVDAAATASAPIDGFALMNGFLNFPREIDASWVNSLFVLSAFSYENYYGVPGLARSVFNDAYYDAARRVYERQPFEASEIPTDLHKLIRADYFDPQFFAGSAYGRIFRETQAYRWVIQTPVRNYYGEADEVIPPGIGKMAMTYQQAMGAGNTKVEAISTGPTTHRGTYARAAAQWKTWFDGK
ncbi:alpha/beta hydrolase [Kaistia nematophila]|uniref:Alpha/beta hydrolase n=1 Tax=Kaistia nematophila TaxID=2994654 RepID=A0A9X3E6Q9_9HYPH|nr:alpha/beta hydrolase [Kaistia nematophila]MCX5572206.1 alpha/beta hydrolase [Kaistia nematophila]